jgi:hypothetical protein
MATKTLKLTDAELGMLENAIEEFELGVQDNWWNSGYTKARVKAFYRLREKVFGTPPPNINDVWEQE